jgi:flagellar basal body P-ring formation protein FlgA
MKQMIFTLAVVLPVTTACADTVVPKRTIKANTIISAQDLKTDPAQVAGAFENIREVAGLEARIALFAGKPIQRGTIGPPAIVDRNQIVELVFMQGGLRISTDGRALARGGTGDRIRVMNLSSRTALFGTVKADGSVQVSD